MRRLWFRNAGIVALVPAAVALPLAFPNAVYVPLVATLAVVAVLLFMANGWRFTVSHLADSAPIVDPIWVAPLAGTTPGEPYLAVAGTVTAATGRFGWMHRHLGAPRKVIPVPAPEPISSSE